MPNFRTIHPYPVIVDNPPTTCEPGRVYEFAENPNANFFEETADPVTGPEEPAIEDTAEEPPAGDTTTTRRGGRRQEPPAGDTATSITTPETSKEGED